MGGQQCQSIGAWYARAVRVLGAVLFLLGSAGAAASLAASFDRSGLRAAAFGIAAPVAVLIALSGALLLFVPRFFG